LKFGLKISQGHSNCCHSSLSAVSYSPMALSCIICEIIAT